MTFGDSNKTSHCFHYLCKSWGKKFPLLRRGPHYYREAFRPIRFEITGHVTQLGPGKDVIRHAYIWHQEREEKKSSLDSLFLAGFSVFIWTDKGKLGPFQSKSHAILPRSIQRELYLLDPLPCPFGHNFLVQNPLCNSFVPLTRRNLKLALLSRRPLIFRPNKMHDFTPY